jgi:hypothetical protein
MVRFLPDSLLPVSSPNDYSPEHSPSRVQAVKRQNRRVPAAPRRRAFGIEPAFSCLAPAPSGSSGLPPHRACVVPTLDTTNRRPRTPPAYCGDGGVLPFVTRGFVDDGRVARCIGDGIANRKPPLSPCSDGDTDSPRAHPGVTNTTKRAQWPVCGDSTTRPNAHLNAGNAPRWRHQVAIAPLATSTRPGRIVPPAPIPRKTRGRSAAALVEAEAVGA